MDPLESLRSHIGKEFTASPSPFMKWLRPVVTSAEKGRLSFRYVVRKEMTNPMGTLHGGVTAGIFDDIAGATIFSLGEPFFYTTINNVIDYFSAAQEGDEIIAETQIVKKGNRIVNVQCEIWNSDRSRLIAKGYTNLFKTEKERRTALQK